MSFVPVSGSRAETALNHIGSVGQATADDLADILDVDAKAVAGILASAAVGRAITYDEKEVPGKGLLKIFRLSVWYAEAMGFNPPPSFDGDAGSEVGAGAPDDGTGKEVAAAGEVADPDAAASAPAATGDEQEVDRLIGAVFGSGVAPTATPDTQEKKQRKPRASRTETEAGMFDAMSRSGCYVA